VKLRGENESRPVLNIKTSINSAILSVNTAIIRQNGGIKLIFGGFYDTMQPNHG
jgi:hypothetical protein